MGKTIVSYNPNEIFFFNFGAVTISCMQLASSLYSGKSSLIRFANLSEDVIIALPFRW